MFKLLKLVVLFSCVCITATNAAELRTITLDNVLCDNVQVMHQTLNQKYGEFIIISAILSNKKNLMNVYVNKETGRWSVIMLNTSKMSCLLFYGDGFTPILNNGNRS